MSIDVVALILGAVAAAVAWGKNQSDMKWIKDAVGELKRDVRELKEGR